MPDTPKSDVESDEDDELLQRCIELGMPENKGIRPMSNTDAFPKPVYPLHSTSCKPKKQYPFKDKSKCYQPPHTDANNVTTLTYQQYLRISAVAHNISMSNKPVNIKQPLPAKKMSKNNYRKPCATKSNVDSHCNENELLQQHVNEMGISKDFPAKKSFHSGIPRNQEFGASQFLFHPRNDLRDNCPDGISDGGDEDDPILDKCIRAGMPSPKLTHNSQNKLPYFHTKHMFQKQQMTSRTSVPGMSSESIKKNNSMKLPPNQPYAPVHSNGVWISNTSFIDVDSMRVYRTEDTPVLSPTASVSDLSSLSINESFLNNSLNSDCSSESDDDELLQQCIRSGMPEANRALA